MSSDPNARPVVVAIAMLLCFASPALAVEIGAVSAANPVMEGTPPEAESRALTIGADVLQDERIVTSTDGSGQITFLDQTSLAVAPDSDIVLDTYVYDPERDAGEIGLSLTKGALRFIGGRITKKTDAEIRTPVATIGVRGGALYVELEDDGALLVVNLAGEHTWIRVGEQKLTMLRPGASARVAPGGGGPRYTGVLGAALLDDKFQRFEGGGGGLRTTLTPEAIQRNIEALIGPHGFDELGTARREPVSTGGAQFYRDVVGLDEREPTVKVLPEPVRDPVPENEPVDGTFDGASGFAAIAPATGFTSANGAEILDPTAQNVLVAPETLALFPTMPGLTGEDVPATRIGVTADGARFVVPVNEASGARSFTDGSAPFGALSGQSVLDAATGIVVADVTTEDGRAGRIVFGTGTEGQLGAPSGTDTLQVRRYGIGPLTSPALGTGTPSAPLMLIEEQGEGFFREDESLGFAKAAHGIVDIRGTGAEQTSYLSVGTGRIGALPGGAAPAPDVGYYGAARSAASAAPVTFDATGTLLATGDGATILGPNGEVIALGSASRTGFIGQDFVATPVNYDSFGGAPIADSGFLEIGVLDSLESVDTASRLPLGVDFDTAVREHGFLDEGDDTAFTGGYASGSAVSRFADGTLSEPYLLRTRDGRSVRMSFDASQNEANAALHLVEGARLPAVEGPGGALERSDIGTVTYSFGSRSTRSAMVDDRTFLLRDRSSEDIGFLPGDTSINGLTGRPARVEGETQQAFRGALISADAASGDWSDIYSGAVPDDDHDYLRWGWWSGAFRFADDDPGAFAGREERTGIGAWISGNRLDNALVAETRGSASFDGHAIVNMVESGRESVAGGSFAMDYDFDARSGAAAFRDLAGYDLDVAVEGDRLGSPTASHHYEGAFAGGAVGRPDIAGSVAGSFFGGPAADSVRATAGQIDFQSARDGGTTLRASGIFGGDAVAEE